jgi:hypothetical protein
MEKKISGKIGEFGIILLFLWLSGMSWEDIPGE